MLVLLGSWPQHFKKINTAVRLEYKNGLIACLSCPFEMELFDQNTSLWCKLFHSDMNIFSFHFLRY